MNTGTTPGNGGRYDGYDVLAQQGHWDSVTAGVVLGRLGPPPTSPFFTVKEEAAARPLLDRLLAQDDDPKIPVYELVDDRLAAAETDGWRYDDMPEDGDAWKRSLRHLDEATAARHGCSFSEVDTDAQKALLESIRTGDDWYGLPARRVWNLWMRYAIAAFYSHPWAWNEIGFGGPAYPRGYANIGLDKREHWERPERDAINPERWAHRVEQARQRHRGGR